MRFPIGLFEIAFAIALLIPRLRLVTIYGVFVWTIVAVITHLQAGQANMVVPSILFSVIADVIIFLTQRKIAQQPAEIKIT